MTFEQEMHLKAADAMLDAWANLRKARRLLILAGDIDAAIDAEKTAGAVEVFMDVIFHRARGD